MKLRASWVNEMNKKIVKDRRLWTLKTENGQRKADQTKNRVKSNFIGISCHFTKQNYQFIWSACLSAWKTLKQSMKISVNFDRSKLIHSIDVREKLRDFDEWKVEIDQMNHDDDQYKKTGK